MKIETKATFYALSILMLAAVTTAADTDFKSQYGKELGNALRKFNAEAAKTSLDNMSEFYKAIIRDTNPSPRDESAWNLRLETIKDMKNRIGDSVSEETMQMTRQFNKIMFWELMLYQATPEIAGNPNNLKAIRDALEICAQKENEAVKELHRKLVQKWRDMYETIPAEELQKHAEYAEINDLVEKTGNIDILSNGEANKKDIKNATEILKKLTDFFGLKEYQFLFNNNKRTA